MYVFYTQCFKLKMMNVLNVVTELLVSIYYFMILFKFLPEAKLAWPAHSKNLTYLVIFIWAVNIFCTICISVQKVFMKIKIYFYKGDTLRQVAPYTDQTITTQGFQSTPRISHIPKLAR